ncbi:MAG TPA: glycosyltransferase family 4 protein [Terriglobales bacterium]|nr:glycosyltransferase family 4 protein [Terriglobales bacterium]
MSSIAYVANSFPEQGEPYVWEQIRELRSRRRRILSCSFRRPTKVHSHLAEFSRSTVYILPLDWPTSLRGLILLIANLHRTLDLLGRVIRGPEPVRKRLRTLAHTYLGAYLAARLRKENVSHIHVHHGYFASWAGMIAARILNAGFSMTLHGSDLLVRADYLDAKLKNCRFCITVSEFNRNYIRAHYPEIDERKLLVHRLGVDLDFWRPIPSHSANSVFSVLSVGRLHSVKNHELLVRACYELKGAHVGFQCIIAGEGPERVKLQELIETQDLASHVELRGQVPREQLPELYRQADVVVFTSRSEGIPLAAMEAMAMERVVLAPSITGIPELITDGQTGFLYEPNSIEDLLANLSDIGRSRFLLDQVRRSARKHVEQAFDGKRNLGNCVAGLLQRIGAPEAKSEVEHANPVLQQI